MKKIPLMVRLDPEIHAKFRAMSELERRTLNAEIEHVLSRYIEDWERDRGPLPLESKTGADS